MLPVSKGLTLDYRIKLKFPVTSTEEHNLLDLEQGHISTVVTRLYHIYLPYGVYGTTIHEPWCLTLLRRELQRIAFDDLSSLRKSDQ